MNNKSNIPHKYPNVDLRKQYRVTMQVGLVFSLLLVLFAFRVPFQPDAEFDIVLGEQDAITIEEIEQTHQQPPPPPPPMPRVPIAVADDIVLPEEIIDFDSELDFTDAPAYVPPPPPPPPAPRQEEERTEAEIFVVVEQMPEIIGGTEALYDLIKYPEIARQAGMEGMVIVQVVIEPDGRPTSPTVARSAGAALDQAAVEAIMKLRFKPGLQRGVPVRVHYAIPVRFRLRDAR